ncbi:MAG TPA: serine/threonine-protein kinase [Polyangia bacterium]|nr:serine/threonine-protein kinase [Polyangia bacterium]
MLERGAPIGRYLVLGLVGRGAMGEVYAAYDPELDRTVAVKLLHVPGDGKVDLAEQKARVLREAQAIARLSHPNVVVVHDVGSFEDRVFVAMEFVDGQTLSYWLHAVPRDWRAILEVFVAAGRGLSAAHAADLVHRDFKGDNVMITGSGQVRVMDFGLARQASNRKSTGGGVPLLDRLSSSADTGSTVALAHQRAVEIGGRLGDARPSTPLEPIGAQSPPVNANLTETGLLVGTPAYMAPEQFRGQLADARSDQFSFCVALYEALYGQRPFAGGTVIDLAQNVIQGRMRAAPVSRRVPGWVRRALLRGLATDADARWLSMDELLAALSRNPNVRGWWYALGGVAVASLVAGSLALGLAPDRPSICRVGADRFAGIWEGAGDRRAVRRPAIARSIAASNRPRSGETFGNLARLFDGYVDRWSRLYQDTCEATNLRGEQSHEVLDLKMTCLRDRLSELGALSDVLVEGNAAAVTDPLGAATSLTPVERCADINSAGSAIAPPGDPAVRQRVNAARDRLVEIKALQDAGRYARALDEAVSVVAEARATGYEPVIAEALNRLALLQVDTGRTREANASAEEALWLAEASRHDELVVELATVEIYVAGYVEHDMVKAQRWINQAQVFLRRIGGHDLLRAWMQNNIGVALDANGDREGAAAQMSSALRIKERILGKDHPDVAFTLANLADTLNAIGRSKEALELSNRGVEILSRTFGVNHPRLLAQLTNRAEILNNLGRHEEAHRDAVRAVAIKGTGSGPELDLMYALAPLAEAELGLGHPARAVAPLEQALHIAEAADAVTELPRLRFAMARALWDSGRDRRRARALAIIVAREAAAYGPAGAGANKALSDPNGIRERAAAWLTAHNDV